VVLFFALIGMSAVLVGMRAVTGRRRLKRERTTAELMPLVADLLTEGRGRDEVLYGLEHLVSARNRGILEEVLLEYARFLKGQEMDTLTYVFEKMGYVDEDIRDLQGGGSIARAKAAFHLGTRRSERSVPYLLRALESGKEDVVFASLNALSHIGTPDAIDGVMRFLSSSRRPQNIRIAEVVLERKRAFAPLVRQQLSSQQDDLEWLRMLIEVAGAMRDLKSVPLLVGYLDHPDESIRASSARALGSIDDAGACEALTDALDDPSAQVRSEAASSLGHAQYDPAIDRLRGGLEDPDLQVKMSCAIALTKMGQAGYSALHEGLNAAEARERGVVEEVLETGKARAAMPTERGQS
jgi:hypothetical protein